MKKIFTGLAAAMALTSTVQAADVTGTVSFTNDYRFRGISQSAGDPAVQGSLDVGFDNGVYAGIWGSNVDFDDDAKLEIDYYVGFANDINDDLSYDVSYGFYTYPGYNTDAEYGELALALYYGDVGFTMAYSDDFFNSGESAQYFGLDYSYGITEAVSLDLHAGYSTGDYWGKVDIDDYQDYSVGISGSVVGLDLSATYLFNSIDNAEEVDKGAFRNDNTLMLSVSRTF
ncbi:TorF family putative porin [uncultured Amphritea sp.]|uniref:TorF family putative porin n=1 Tax=uncultured Amphritea sp. TaxID=981605 RepID=UPI002607EEC0|nr:TorF family putative porin [uncultured Amphritea sp.]